MTVTKLRIERIKLDGGTQSRDEIKANVVEDYAEALRNNAHFPAVTVFHDGADYWLADGFHRVHAHKLLNWLEIDADVQQGTRQYTELYSVGANSSHGLRRTNADKRRAVETLLRDAEWRHWVDAEISRRTGVSAMSVGRYRAELISNNVIDTPAERTVQRNGTTYTQNTGNIGQRPTPQPAPKPVIPEPIWPDYDPETGEVKAEPQEDTRSYPQELLEAAHRPMSPMPYQPPTLGQVEADSTIEEVRRLLQRLLSFREKVDPSIFYGDVVGAGVVQMAYHTAQMLLSWQPEANEPAVATQQAHKIITVDAS